jgi:phosphohistidine phosphatase
MPVYLMRHGDAKSEAEDPARPLSDRGRAQVERVARLLAGRGVAVAEIRHSGLLRARQTAEVLAAHLHPARGVRAVEGLAPNDDPAQARAECEGAVEPLALVGHLPHLARLATALLGPDPGREPIQFETAAVACLGQGELGWALEWLVGPDSAA